MEQHFNSNKHSPERVNSKQSNSVATNFIGGAYAGFKINSVQFIPNDNVSLSVVSWYRVLRKRNQINNSTSQKAMAVLKLSMMLCSQ